MLVATSDRFLSLTSIQQRFFLPNRGLVLQRKRSSVSTPVLITLAHPKLHILYSPRSTSLLERRLKPFKVSIMWETGMSRLGNACLCNVIEWLKEYRRSGWCREVPWLGGLRRMSEDHLLHRIKEMRRSSRLITRRYKAMVLARSWSDDEADRSNSWNEFGQAAILVLG